MSASLRSLSDPEILSRTYALAGQERRVTLALLEHLNEVERRRLFLKNGFSSMFAYCTTRLRMSEAAAGRRIRTARCLARFPELHALLESGEVHLSSVSMVAKYLRPGNATDILARIRGRSRREVERIVAELEPRAVLPPDRVRPVVVPVVSAVPVAVASAANVASAAGVRSTAAADGPADSAAACTGPAEPVAAVVPANPAGRAVPAAPPIPAAAARPITVAGDSASTRSVEGEVAGNDRASSPSDVRFKHHAVIQFAASEEFLELVERVRSVASHRLPPNATLEQVFALVMSEYVKREDPQARHERRDARRDAARPRNAVQKQGDMENTRPVEKTPPAVKSPRWIPTHVRDRVYARDRGCCTYVGPGGLRCGSSRHVQVDHVVPVARGGGATVDNLRLLCAQHNRLEAERLMGRSAAWRGAPEG